MLDLGIRVGTKERGLPVAVNCWNITEKEVKWKGLQIQIRFNVEEDKKHKKKWMDEKANGPRSPVIPANPGARKPFRLLFFSFSSHNHGRTFFPILFVQLKMAFYSFKWMAQNIIKPDQDRCMFSGAMAVEDATQPLGLCCRQPFSNNF